MTTQQQDSPQSPELSPERAVAIRQAIAAGDRGLVLNNWETMFRFAQKVAASQFCPAGFSEADCFIALQKGAEVGLTPMQSLESIYIVNNRATLFGDAVKGICDASGLMVDYHQEEIGEFPKDDYGWRITSQRKGRSKPMVTTYTVADARRAKIWEKRIERNGRSIDTPWITAPKRMLLFRARGFNLRDNFSDVLKGLQIGELVDDESLEGFEHAKAAVGKVVEPRFEEPAPAPPAPPPRSAPQRRGPGRPPKAQPPQQANLSGLESAQPADSPKPDNPTSSAKSESAGPLVSVLLEEVIARLDAAKIPHAKFVELLYRNEWVQADDVAQIRAGYVGIEKCDPEGLQAALEAWPHILEELKKL